MKRPSAISARPLRTMPPRSIIAASIQGCFDRGLALAVATALVVSPASAQSSRVPANALPKGVVAVPGTSVLQPEVVRGRFAPYTVTGNVATITQVDAAGILRWNSFDIGSAAQVIIYQPGASSVLLNKIDGGLPENLNRTVIEGMLTSRTASGGRGGQVYLYNSNGIIFGKNSTVDVGSLVASSLKIDDSRFYAGILAPSLDPILAAEVASPGAILVEGDATSQAKITASTGGRVMLIGPQVTNNGTLVAKDGQVVLAAGSSVFLRSPSDANMRGLVVQVGNNSSTDKALNDVLGTIDVGHGNATMVGLAVNQSGRISANTSVSLNGSIYLRAVAGTPASDNGVPQIGGELVLGVGSSTRIDPDLSDKSTAADSPAFKPSIVDLQGQHIVVGENASIIAHGGKVTIAAHANPDPLNSLPFSPSRVDLGAGSLIDVSGSSGTELAMESNVIQVELRGTELADNPLLRNSALRGTKANIDIRKGTAIANVSGWLSQVQHNVGELTAAGGNVSITSEGDIIQRGGSSVAVSGGWVRYLDGYVNTTKLGYSGRLVDIGSAATGIAYDSSVDLGNSRGSFEKGYLQGYDAGTVSFSAPAMALRGNLAASVTIGPRQRDSGQTSAAASKYVNGFLVSASDSSVRLNYMADRLRPLGGTLIVGNAGVIGGSGRPTVVGNADQMGYTGLISLGGTALTSALPAPGEAMDPASAASPLESRLNLDIATLSGSGFASFNALTAGNIELDGPVNLASGGKLTLGASGNVILNAGVTAHGGKLIAAAGSSLNIAADSRFDFSGLWTNDYSASSPARDADGNLVGNIALSGGSVDFSGRFVNVGDRTSIDVSGGGWYSASGKLKKGAAGTVTMALRQNTAADTDAALRLGQNLALSGYGLSQGGSLNLTGRGIIIGANAAVDGDLAFVDSRFFSAGGFTSFSLASVDTLTVADNTVIMPRAQSWFLGRGYQNVSSGAIASVATPTMLDLTGLNGGRPAVSMGLSGSNRLVFGHQAALDLDPKATATLTSGNQVTIDGTIRAPAGTINVFLNAATPGPTDTNFDAARSVWFGSSAKLLARGTTDLVYTDGRGIASGDVLGGGTLRVGQLTADGAFTTLTGYLVAETGSEFDVSGVTSAPLTFASASGGTQIKMVGSAAGSVEMRAREGLLFAGSLKGEGGSGEQGGSLTMVLDRENSAGAVGAYPQNERVFTLASSAPGGGIIPTGLEPNQPILGREGQGWLTLDAIASGGFDRMTFKSQDAIAFAQGTGTMTLTAGSSLTLDTPAIRSGDSGTVALKSAFVQLGSTDWRYQSAPAAINGNATLSVLAADRNNASGTLDLIGYSATQGFGEVNLTALSDIRLLGAAPKKADGSFVNLAKGPSSSDANDKLLSPCVPGAFSVGHDLNMASAQAYVTTLSDFTLNAANSVTVSDNGRGAIAPYSAGGKLTISADTITQNGRLLAPFGSIILQGATAISYGSDSVTSVAGSGLVPFGSVQNGRDWIYDFGNGWAVNFSTGTTASSNLLVAPLPEKTISSIAPSVTLAATATLDLSGGGALYAYEFSPGPGGSKDFLAKSTTGGLTFAILPGYVASVAPRDFQYGQDNSLNAGDSIYLSGIAGLAAGNYTLLPAHYALLPGAFSISSVSGFQDAVSSANHVNPDGSLIVTGYRFSNSTGNGSNRWSGFSLLSSEQVRTRSEYSDYSAGSFFSAQAASEGVIKPMLPADGGRVSFDVGQTLALGGITKLNGAAGGGSGSADVASSGVLHVVSSGDQGGGGEVVVTADQLAALGADSLLLGGLRYQSNDGTMHVVVKSTTVNVGSDTGHPVSMSGADLILAASDTVSVSAGVTMTSSGIPNGGSQDISIVTAAYPGTLVTGVDAEGALLRLNGSGAGMVRRGTLNANVLKGSLNIDPNATVMAKGGVVLDATKNFNISSVLNFAGGSALTVGASAISLGDGIPSNVLGLHLDSSVLSKLNGLASLGLSSYSAPLGFYGTPSGVSGTPAIALGNSGMTLSLSAQGIQAYGSGDAKVQAKTLNLNGGSAYTPADVALPAASVGPMNIEVGDLSIGAGSFKVNGYATVAVTATGDVMGIASGTFSSGSDLNVAAGRITAASGSDTTLSASGALTLAKTSSASASTSAAPFGGRLRLAGNSIVSSANIEAHSGRVDMTSVNGIQITGGVVDVSGVPVTMVDAVAYAPGGSVYLNGGSGNVNIASTALIDVSAVGAEAGLISVTASNGSTGTLNLNGGTSNLKGAATVGINGKAQSQGRFILDVDLLPQFGALNEQLNNVGFKESRTFRVRHDNVTLSQGEAIIAHEVVIAADNGNVTVGGTVNANGAEFGTVTAHSAEGASSKGGVIQLYAGQATSSGGSGNVILQNSAVLSATATQAASSAAGSTGDGGRIVIGTSTADGSQPGAISGNAGIQIADGATINVSGMGSSGQGGQVLLRAPRVSTNNVAVSTTGNSTLSNAVVGAADFAIEGYKVYASSSNVNIGTAADTPNNSSLQAATTAGAVPTAGKMYSDSNTFLSAGNIGTMQTRLGSGVAFRAGVEVRAAGDINVSVNETASNPQDRGWNLNAWRFGNQPGALTLRAGGNLTINGSISDGFVKPSSANATANKLGMPDWSLDPTGGASWSYRFTGGADLAAANPLVIKPSTSVGDVTFKFARASSSTATDQPVATVRTGTGRIDVAAGRDIVLSSTTSLSKLLGAQLYTAGRATTPIGFELPTNTLNTSYAATTSPARDKTVATFGANGGGISLYAAEDVLGTPTLQMVDNWLYRQGRTDDGKTLVANPAWWSRYDYFNEGVATFGGGDISVVADRHVKDLSVSVATDAWTVALQDPSTLAYLVAGSQLIEQGGGDLRVRAGGDIKGGVFYVQKGAGDLRADGSLTGGSTVFTNVLYSSLITGSANAQNLYPVLAIGDASFQVTAGKDLTLEGVFNPTLTNQSVNNLGRSTFTDSTIPTQYSAFSTFGSTSSISLTAVSGNVSLIENQTLMKAAGTTGATDMPTTSVTGYLRDSFLLMLPPTLEVAALSGNVSLGNGFSLWASPVGNLDLLAAGSVTTTNSLTNGWTQPLVMLDLSTDSQPTAANPRKLVTGGVTTDFNLLFGKQIDGLPAHAAVGLHASDTQQARVIAVTGDVDFSKATSASVKSVRLVLPKTTEIIAGRDVVNLGFKIQNNSGSDVTRIVAGRDFIDSTVVTGSNILAHYIEGPGRVEILAGRNIDLGNSDQGLVTRGNLDNPYLPETGASIMLMAGITAPDYVGFLRDSLGMSGSDAYLSGYAVAHRSEINDQFFALLAKVTGATHDQDLDLAAYDKAIGSLFPVRNLLAGLVRNSLGIKGSDEQLIAYARANMSQLNTQHFGNILTHDEVVQLGDPLLDSVTFNTLIAKVLPAKTFLTGDINVFGSEVKTERGGSIDLFAPGGSVYAGLVDVPVYLKSKAPSKLGIFTIKGGEIRSLVKQDFSVNQGRVFTLGGGDITLASQFGNIDAGRGSKTASSTPPPLVTTDASGNVSIDISGSISGSGIATLQTGPEVPAADIYAIAPRGIFDAGDAGARSSAGISIIGECHNCSNIQAQGTITGAGSPTAAVSSSGTTAPSAPVTKTDSFAKDATPDPNAATTLRVEVVGYGGSDGQQSVTRSSQNAQPSDSGSGKNSPAAEGGSNDGKKINLNNP